MEKLKASLALALVTLALVGCAQRYRMTLTNGNSISTASKPRLNKEGTAYIYKDHRGKEAWVFAGKVTEIAPED